MTRMTQVDIRLAADATSWADVAGLLFAYQRETAVEVGATEPERPEEVWLPVRREVMDPASVYRSYLVAYDQGRPVMVAGVPSMAATAARWSAGKASSKDPKLVDRRRPATAANLPWPRARRPPAVAVLGSHRLCPEITLRSISGSPDDAGCSSVSGGRSFSGGKTGLRVTST